MICIWWFNFFCNLILKIDQIELSNWSDPFRHSQQLLSECLLNDYNFEIMKLYYFEQICKCTSTKMHAQDDDYSIFLFLIWMKERIFNSWGNAKLLISVFLILKQQSSSSGKIQNWFLKLFAKIKWMKFELIT